MSAECASIVAPPPERGRLRRACRTHGTRPAGNYGTSAFLFRRRQVATMFLSFALACAGPPGKDGQPGATAGDAGTTSDAGSGSAGTVDYGVLTPGEIEVAKMSAVLTDVTIPADGRPVVKLKVTERHGSGVRGLSATAANWRFALIKLAQGVNGSANDSWVSYMAANDHSTTSTETATTTGLTDNGDGTYAYRFDKVVNAGVAAAGTVYEPSKVHRLIVLLYATGNPFPPINVVKEFIPATGVDVTGQNDKVPGDGSACLSCHTQFRAISGETGELGSGQFHGGVRFDIRTCAACHNDQKRFQVSGTAFDSPSVATDGTWVGDRTVLNNEAFLNFPVFIHKLHMGEDLKMTGGTYKGFAKPYEITYPQDVRNCVKCHTSSAASPAPLADNWKNQPSQRACGACHDDISFVSPAPNGRHGGKNKDGLHSGGPVAVDTSCTLCHAAGGPAGDVPSAHLAVSDPNLHNIYLDQGATGNSNTNAAYVAAAGVVPAGAQVPTYDVKSVSTWDDGGVTRPQIVFKIKLDGADVVFPAPTGSNELIPNFVGSPSASFSWAVPQDCAGDADCLAGKTTSKVGKPRPADFNASGSAYIRNVWNGTGTCSDAAATTTRTGAGTLTGPDANGYYTLKLTCVVIPAAASMLTGGIGYTYNLGSTPNFISNNQPLTQINLPAYPYTPNTPPAQGGKGGLIVPAPDIAKVATGFTARRPIVANEKCASCHVQLGVGPDFHAGQRNDAPTCSFCHKPNLTSNGWSANVKDFVHSIHGAEKRAVKFTWHEKSATQGYWQTTYPAVLNRCETCHLAGTYDFSTAAMTTALPNMLPSTVGQGTYAASPALSPYVTAGTDYGAGFIFTPLTGASTEAAPTTLVISPITAACSACHDSPAAVDHMQTNGGSFWEKRSTALTKPQQEECLICHGPNRIAAIGLVHADKTP
jgi:OmcA/MtrC family decaheme c-type cytochrome